MHGAFKKIVPCVILLIGLVWRLFFLNHCSLWPDEGLYLSLAEKVSHNPLNLTDPNGRFFFLNPPLYIYLLSLISHIPHENTIMLGRLLTVFFDIGIIYVVYRLAFGLYNQKVALLASLLVAFNPLHLWMSTRILVDIPLTFFVYLALLLLLLGRLGWFFGASTAAILTKYPALPLFIMPFTNQFRRKPGPWLMLFFLGMIFVSLFVGNNPEWADAPQWIRYFWGFIGMPEAAKIFRECFFFLDLTVIGLALVGFVFALKRGELSALLVWLLVFGAIRLFLPWEVFRMSRYSLPLFPGIMIMASAGTYELYARIKARRPHLKAVTGVVLILMIASVFLIYAFRGYEVSTLNAMTFTGYREAANVLTHVGDDHTLLTASQSQFAYYLPKFQVFDLPRKTTPVDLIHLMVEKKIRYLAIDRWSPHQPRWCGSYPFAQRGFETIYASDNFFIFRLRPESLPAKGSS